MKALVLKATIGAAIVSANLCAIPAIAAERGKEVDTAKVVYSDLDLTTEEGVEKLRDRFRSAARDVCKMNDREVGSRMASRESRACYQERMDAFAVQVDEIQRRQLNGG
jgi:UrcA family protein